MGSSADEIVPLYQGGNSIPEVAEITGFSRSTVRHHVKNAGILRSRAEGIQNAARKGRMGHGRRRESRTFTDEWRHNIALARRAHADQHARGYRVTVTGYIEITRGPNKGRLQHRIVAEEEIGRQLQSWEHVHHIDGDRANNDPSNLQVLPSEEHASLHAHERAPLRDRDNFGRFK